MDKYSILPSDDKNCLFSVSVFTQVKFYQIEKSALILVVMEIWEEKMPSCMK